MSIIHHNYKCMLHETRASIEIVQVNAVQAGLRQVLKAYIAWQNFLEIKFADFPDDDVRVNNPAFRSAVDGVSLQQHLLFSCFNCKS